MTVPYHKLERNGLKRDPHADGSSDIYMCHGFPKIIDGWMGRTKEELPRREMRGYAAMLFYYYIYILKVWYFNTYLRIC